MKMLNNIKNDNIQMKNKTFIGVVGVLLVIFGFLMTIPLTIRGGIYNYGLIITLPSIIIGVLLIAWIIGE